MNVSEVSIRNLYATKLNLNKKRKPQQVYIPKVKKLKKFKPEHLPRVKKPKPPKIKKHLPPKVIYQSPWIRRYTDVLHNRKLLEKDRSACERMQYYIGDITSKLKILKIECDRSEIIALSILLCSDISISKASKMFEINSIKLKAITNAYLYE